MTVVRVALATTVLALGVCAATFTAGASAATIDPTPAQIRIAIRQAERSKSLWATVNICNSRRYPNTIGIRGQMPSLGFAAWLSMSIQLNYFDTTKKQFLTDGAAQTIRLGRSSTKLQQGGETWQFSGPVLLDATVQFIWRRSGKLLGETTQTTSAGHPSADFGSPPRYSAEQCQIP